MLNQIIRAQLIHPPLLIRTGAMLVLMALLASGTSTVAEEPGRNPAPATKPAETSYQPKDTRRHDEFLKIVQAGDIDVVFFGDSITDFWRRQGKAVWAKHFAPLKAANFGIGGDVYQGVLWRIQNGELEGIHPKLVVLLIGTNNNNQKPEAIAEGIKAIISEIQTRSPGTRILLHGIFPKGPALTPTRNRIAQVNKIISTYAHPDDPKRVVYVDIGDKFLNADGSINKELMPDTLHPSAKGYEMWAEAIIGTVNEELQPAVKPAATTRPVVPATP